MKKSKKILCILVCLLLMMTFVSCGSKKSSEGKKNNIELEELSANEIINKVYENMGEDTYLSCDAEITVDIDYNTENILINGDMKRKSNKDDKLMYTGMNLSIETSGQKLEMPVEIYQIEENDIIKKYMFTYGKWLYDEIPVEEFENNQDLKVTTEFLESINMGEFLENNDLVNVSIDKDKYILEISFSAEESIEMMKKLNLEQFNIDLSDLPEIEMDLKYIVNGENFLVDSAIMNLNTGIIKSKGDFMIINSCKIDMKNIYNDNENIIIPKEALEAEILS